MTQNRAGRRLAQVVARSVTAVLLGTTLVACSSDDEGADDPSPSASTSGSAAPAPQAPLRLKVGEVAGKISKGTSQRVSTSVAGVVTDWFDAAYLGGDYPRSRFADSFPGFTPGASRQAWAEAWLMSNKSIGPDVDAITPRTRRVVVDLLAPGGHAAAATARFTLAFDARGRGERADRTVTVKGRVFLTREQRRKGVGPWQIFGYDVVRTAR